MVKFEAHMISRGVWHDNAVMIMECQQLQSQGIVLFIHAMKVWDKFPYDTKSMTHGTF